ncbi:acyl carrier protein [[Pseudopropionibacterium] massiliense]|uniref:acyl carrier protein n=1 Tax=[Pseudopropionibacterium] massiliense TaxID=2220000 RepID=UPI0010318787|nr:acyl carrier protein [[Pseudopropionibacterium] massiliense]
MTEIDFITALAEFTTRTPETLTLADDMDAVGLDSIGVFEFAMKLEDELGQTIQFTDNVTTVQDLFDCVEEAAG